MNRLLPSLALLLLAACGGAAENGSDAPAVNDGAMAGAAPAARNDAAPSATAADSPALYLPAPGTHRARAMALAPPVELQALERRLAAAVRANRAWYEAWLRQHPTGELPWHENFGVSEADYRRFLALTRQIGLREIGPVTLTVTRRPDGGLALAATGQAAPLTGIVFAPDHSRAETPRGPLASRAPVANREPNSPTGPWQGVQWSNAGTGAAPPVRLALGRRAQGDMLIFYDYGPTDAETVILLYPAAPR